jgi:hypothetical protein
LLKGDQPLLQPFVSITCHSCGYIALIGNNQMMKQMAAAIVVLTLAGLGTARADDDCHVPMERWQPREAVQTMAAGRGWTVTRIKIDDGCYEIRGTDEGGRPFKAKIDPATLEIVKLRYKDRDDDRHGARRQRTQNIGPEAADGASANGLLGTNTRPKAVVK